MVVTAPGLLAGRERVREVGLLDLLRPGQEGRRPAHPAVSVQRGRGHGSSRLPQKVARGGQHS